MRVMRGGGGGLGVGTGCFFKGCRSLGFEPRWLRVLAALGFMGMGIACSCA